MTTPTKRQLPDLLQQRQQIFRQLESVDAEILGMLVNAQAALSVLGLMAPQSPQSQPQPQSFDLRGLVEGAHKPFAAASHALLEVSKRVGVSDFLTMHASKVLTEHGRPMKTRELYEAISAKGVEIPGKDPQNNLSAHLSRSEKLRPTGNGWWFKAEKEVPTTGGT